MISFSLCFVFRIRNWRSSKVVKGKLGEIGWNNDWNMIWLFCRILVEERVVKIDVELKNAVFFQSVSATRIFIRYVEVCKQSPTPIADAIGPSSGGNYTGDVRSYSCIAGFTWSDLETGAKQIRCLQSGSWSTILQRCLSSPYMCYSIIFLGWPLYYYI